MSDPGDNINRQDADAALRARTDARSQSRLGILSAQGMDMLSLEEKTLFEYLNEDARNFVIKQDRNYHLVNSRDILRNLEQATVFACRQVGSPNASNVDMSTELFNARRMGALTGYIEMESMRRALHKVSAHNTRVFMVSDPVRSVAAVVGMLFYEGRRNMVGAEHCQAGADGDIVKLYPILVDGIPKIQYEEEHIDDVPLLVSAYLISTNALYDEASDLREQIKTAYEQLGDMVFGTGVSDVDKKILRILTNDDMGTISELVSTFYPAIHTILVRAGLKDFSFLKDVKILRVFKCTHRVNSDNIIRNLLNNALTLQVLTIHITRPIAMYERFHEFRGLKKLNLAGVSEHQHVLEAISLIPKLELLVMNVEGPLDFSPLTNVPHLRKLALDMADFTGDISPIGNLRSLTHLKLLIPSYSGSFSSLSTLSLLTQLGITCDSILDIDLSMMSIRQLNFEGRQ